MTYDEPSDDDLLSPAQAAARFGVTTSTVRRWASAGKLRWVRAGNGHRRFSASDIAQLTTFEAEPGRTSRADQGS